MCWRTPVTSLPSLQSPDVVVEFVHLALVIGAEGCRVVLVQIAVPLLHGGLTGRNVSSSLGMGRAFTLFAPH